MNEEKEWQFIQPYLEPIVPLAKQSGVEEVCVLSTGEVFVHKKDGIEKADITFRCEDAATVMRYLRTHLRVEHDEDSPYISGSLPLVKWRLSGQLPPVVRNPSFTLRIPSSQNIAFSSLVENGFISPTQADFLRDALLNKKLNIAVGGTTGSGKTTFTTCLLNELRYAKKIEKIVVLEDTNEINLDVPYAEYFCTSQHSSMREALVHALRQTPDRIVVGEVREGNTMDELLRALNTGHDGTVFTIHLKSAHLIFERIQWLMAMVGRTVLPCMLAELVNVVVFLENKKVLKVGRLEFSSHQDKVSLIDVE